MIDGLSLALTVLCLGTSLVAGVRVAGGRYRQAAFTPTLVIVQLGLVVQAVLDVIGWLGGHRPAEPATHAAYLVASLAVVPLVATETRRDDGTWSGALLIVALVVLAVLVVRLQTTWRSA